MVMIGIVGHSIRFVLFSMENVNLFNSLYDTPLFLIFFLKVAFGHVVAFVGMTIIHEFPTLREAFGNAAKEALENQAALRLRWNNTRTRTQSRCDGDGVEDEFVDVCG
jgi:hypothetical protein